MGPFLGESTHMVIIVLESTNTLERPISNFASIYLSRLLNIASVYSQATNLLVCIEKFNVKLSELAVNIFSLYSTGPVYVILNINISHYLIL